MAVYNLDKISNWYDDFINLKNKFNNSYYNDYKSCYIRNSTDNTIKKMQKELNNHYSRIYKIYSNVDIAWKEYLSDLRNVDSRLAGGKGGITASSVSSKISKLPILKEYKRSLNVEIKSISGVVGAAKKIGWSGDKTVSQNLKNFGEKCAASVTSLGVSLIEGLGKLVEDTVDLASLTGTVVTSVGTGIADLGNYVASKLTGNENLKTDYTKQMWEDTRSFVSTDYTEQIFDSFYTNTTAGKYIKENAYGFDILRNIGTEIGEVVGVVALSAITGGGAAVLYGSAKTSEHAEKNWQDENTGILEGLVKSGIQGTADGLFFALGMKGDAVTKAAARKVVEEGSKETLKKAGILGTKMLFEAGTSVVQDGTTMMVDALFMDNIAKDAKGNKIVFNNYMDKLNYSYEQAGGAKGLITSMGTACILSGISDFSDVFDIHGVTKNIDTNSTVKNTNVNSSNIGKQVDNINIKNVDAFKIHGSLDEQIAKTNRYIEKGGSVTLYVNSVDDIPANVWENVKRPIIDDKNVYIITKNGEKFYWGEPIDAHMLKKSTNISKQVDNINTKNTYTKQQKTEIWIEYNNMLDKWGDEFDYYKELYYNNGAGDLNKISEFHNDFRRIIDIENKLDLTGTKYSVTAQDGIPKYTEASKLEYDNYNPNFSDSAMKKSIKNFYFSDASMNNEILKYSNVAASDLYISESRIKEYEKAFGLNYASDPHDKKIINIFETLARNSGNIPDENVAKIVRNIDSISKVEKRFGIGEWDSTSAYVYNSVNINSKVLDCSEDIINSEMMHEFGHAYFHTFNGDASNNYEITLSDSKKQIIQNAQKKLSENPEKYIKTLRKTQTIYNESMSETIRWYDTQKLKENVKIKDMVEKMYIENGVDSLSKMVYSAKKIKDVNEILANVGMESADLIEILNNKDLTTQILQVQNNISNQQSHLDEIMGSYSKKCDYRKLSSTINSITQKIEHIDPVTGEKIYCTYHHRDSYWDSISKEDSCRRTYDELLADYFSLAANGRVKVLDQMEDMFGSELMELIRGEFKSIVDKLETSGLLIN